MILLAIFFYGIVHGRTMVDAFLDDLKILYPKSDCLVNIDWEGLSEKNMLLLQPDEKNASLTSIEKKTGNVSIINMFFFPSQKVTNEVSNTMTMATDQKVSQNCYSNMLTTLNLRENSEKIFSWLLQHTGTILCCSMMSLYGIFFYYILKIGHYLEQQDNWFLWEQSTSLQELKEVDSQELEKRLLIEIQSRYMYTAFPNDVQFPLSKFLNETTSELEKLKFYTLLYRWMCQIKCDILFPFNRDVWDDIECRKERLIFYRDIFRQWRIGHNIKKLC